MMPSHQLTHSLSGIKLRRYQHVCRPARWLSKQLIWLADSKQVQGLTGLTRTRACTFVSAPYCLTCRCSGATIRGAGNITYQPPHRRADDTVPETKAASVVLTSDVVQQSVGGGSKKGGAAPQPPRQGTLLQLTYPTSGPRRQ
jgi:hypothetical protein